MFESVKKECKENLYIFSLDLEDQFKAFREKAKAAMPGSDWSPFELTQGLPPERADIVIIGGGVIGWSIAYWLKRKLMSQDSLRVLLVEKDPTVSPVHLSCMHLQSSVFSSYFGFRLFFLFFSIFSVQPVLHGALCRRNSAAVLTEGEHPALSGLR